LDRMSLIMMKIFDIGLCKIFARFAKIWWG